MIGILFAFNQMIMQLGSIIRSGGKKFVVCAMTAQTSINNK